MDSPVNAKLGTGVESLPTDSALTRLLPSVGPLVNDEARALVEASPTFPTSTHGYPISLCLPSGLLIVRFEEVPEAPCWLFMC